MRVVDFWMSAHWVALSRIDKMGTVVVLPAMRRSAALGGLLGLGWRCRIIQRWVCAAFSFVMQFAEGALDEAGQFLGRAIDRLVHRSRIEGDGYGLVVFEAGLHGATHFVATALRPVFVA